MMGGIIGFELEVELLEGSPAGPRPELADKASLLKNLGGRGSTLPARIYRWFL
jgi:hypothetical protein